MKKMLLMGPRGVGKTSMHRVIFANLPAKQTNKIGYTVAKEEHNISLLGTVTLNLWDCGSQDSFMQEYFDSKKQLIFTGVSMLLFVFQLQQTQENNAISMQSFRLSLINCYHYSPNAKIFILIHKIDQVSSPQREALFRKKKEKIQQIVSEMKGNVQSYFATTIWNESLYQAWSQIVQSMIPNKQLMKDTLKRLSLACDCSQALLFQKNTFLILSHYHQQKMEDIFIYQRLAILLKTLKITCLKAGASIASVDFSTNSSSGTIIQFTKSLSLMMISKSPASLTQALILLNVKNLRKYFQGSKTVLDPILS